MPWTLKELENFKSRVIEHGVGCWEWVGRLTYHGRPRVVFEGKKQYGHRVSWLIYRGAIPQGALVLHKCDNPECTNPEHLFLGSQNDNMKDAMNKGRVSSESTLRGWEHRRTIHGPTGRRS